MGIIEGTQWLLLLLPAIAGGFVQGVSGMGYGIVVMLFYPMIMSVGLGSGVAQCASIVLNYFMAIKYRKDTSPKLCVLPWIFYIPVYFISLYFAMKLDAAFLKPVLGLFLVLMSIYCMCFADKIHIKANPRNAFICAGLGAIIDSFFGIGGPPIVLYFLATTKKKEEYLGTIQTYFAVTNTCAAFMRIYRGQMTLQILPMVLAAAAVTMIGVILGGRFVKKIDQLTMKKLIYGFVGVAGALTFITNIQYLIEVL